jgi:hypothetical protein
MSPLFVALIVALLMMAGAMAAGFLRKHLASHHFDDKTKDVVKLGLGFLATLSALVMGLIVSSSKASYDTKNEMVHTSAALIIEFDSNLRRIGPEAEPVRQLLQQAVASTMHQLWAGDGVAKGVPADANKRLTGQLGKMLSELTLKNETQRQAQANALNVLGDLARINAVSFTQQGSNVMQPLLVVVTCWMILTIMGWTLFAPGNHTVTAVNVVCSLSVASVIFLILEMDQPFGGIISISDAPMRAALLNLSDPG